jgi:hypothetical protein
LSPKNLLPILVMLVLAACTGPELREPIDATSTKPPLLFTLAELAVEDATSLPPTTGFRDRERSERLAEATKEFLDARLQTGMGMGWLQVTIEEARVLEQELEPEGTLRETITRAPDRVLDALVRVRLAVMGADGLEQSSVQVEVQRRRPILRNTSVMARDAEASRLIGDLLVQLDDELTAAVQQDLNAYLL